MVVTDQPAPPGRP